MLFQYFTVGFLILYFNRVYVTCQGNSSLVFAIDYTWSMYDDIRQVKSGSEQILKDVLKAKSSEIANIVLVTFNDPAVDLKNVTKDPNVFKKALSEIKIWAPYGNDCPEKSLSGMITGLENSLPNSYMYVFTDASAKDKNRVREVIDLCIKKQTQIFIIVTFDYHCYDYPNPVFKVYYDITEKCNGQVIFIDKDDVKKFIVSFTPTVNDPKAVVMRQTIPVQDFGTPKRFNLDDRIDYATVFASGENVGLEVGKNNFKDKVITTQLMWTKTVKILKVFNTVPGEYEAKVKGANDVTIVVYAKTDFKFEHGFSVIVPKSLDDASRRPIAGKKQHLSVLVNDPEHGVRIGRVNILSPKGKMLTSIPLKHVAGDFYVTDKFVSPNSPFIIQVNGTNKQTGTSILRNSRTVIEPIEPIPEVVIKEKVPTVTISEGSKIDVKYNGSVVLRCRISAYPNPIISWQKADGTFLKSNVDVVDPPYDFVSYLKVHEVTKSQNYVCRGKNKLGNKFSAIHVNVISPFEVTRDLPAVTKAEFKKNVILTCSMKFDSNLQTAYHWYFKDSSGDVKAVSNNRLEHYNNTALTIKTIDIHRQGEYIYRIWVKNNKNVNRTCKTKVKINNLEKPVISLNFEYIKVSEKNQAKISCRITKGIPRPTITWKFQKNGKPDRILQTESSENLIIKEVSLDNAGKYICTATNPLGSVEGKAELEVTKVPKVSVQGKSNVMVEYGTTQEFTCKVIAHPQPRIVWKDQFGNVINTPQAAANGYEFTSRLMVSNIKRPAQYTCYAENDDGHDSKAVSVSPKSPFVVGLKLQDTIKVKYGKPVELFCDIKSALPIERAWYSDKERELSLKGISLKEKYPKEFVIKYMDINLQGRYGCKVWLASDPKVFIEQNTTLVIDDLSPPSITATQDISNKTFKASCLTKGTPKPSVSWYYATDIKGDFNNNLQVTGEEFKLHNIKLKHTGIYKCIAENAVGKREKTFELIVKEPPQIIADKTKYLALVGDSVLEIPCNVTGYPEPTIVWKNNENKVITSDFKYDVKRTLNIVYLYIKHPSQNDTSNVTCEASNYLGTESKIFETFVTDEFQNDENFKGDTKGVFILETDSKDIECNIPHVDSKSVRWYKDGLLSNVVGTHYPIKNASELNDGNYTCRVNKVNESLSETYAVDVGTKPKFAMEYDSTIIFWEGYENDYVDCTVTSSKPLDQHFTKIEWLYNGNKTNVKEYQHPILGWGEYSCKVSNVFGDTERSNNVTTDGCLIRRKVDIDNNPPLILRFDIEVESTRSMYSGNKYMLMAMEQRMKISCYNSHHKNHFKIFDEEMLIAECLGEDYFIINNNVYKYSDIKCEKPVEITIDNTKNTCTHERSELIKVGFNIDSGGFIETYVVCFDNELKVPTFVFTEISQSNLGNQIDYDKWMNISSYQGVTNTDCNNESECCFGKEQLVNAVDVAFGPPQAATFYDYNAVGIWKPCGNESRLSWRTIEEDVRSLLDFYNIIPVWTGASHYEQQSIGMIPHYLWKVIDSHGVIVYVNNPKLTKEDIKCSSRMKNHNTLNRFMKYEDPFIYLCSIDEFSKVFNISLNLFF